MVVPRRAVTEEEWAGSCPESCGEEEGCGEGAGEGSIEGLVGESVDG